MGKYYLVTGEGHDLESMVLEGTGEVDGGGFLLVGIDGKMDWVLETNLTEITSDDFHTILMQAAYGDTDRLDRVYAALANGTY